MAENCGFSANFDPLEIDGFFQTLADWDVQIRNVTSDYQKLVP